VPLSCAIHTASSSHVCGSSFILVNPKQRVIQVDRAKDYIGYVMQQRQGPKDKVTIDATRFRDDLSIVDVPEVPNVASLLLHLVL